MPFSQDWKDDPERVAGLAEYRADLDRGLAVGHAVPGTSILGDAQARRIQSAYDMAVGVAAKLDRIDALPQPKPRSPLQQIGDLIGKLTFTELLALDARLFSTGYPHVGDESTTHRLSTLSQLGTTLSGEGST